MTPGTHQDQSITDASLLVEFYFPLEEITFQASHSLKLSVPAEKKATIVQLFKAMIDSM